MAGQRTSRLFPTEINRKTGNHAAQKYRRPDVPVNLAGGANPGSGRNPKSCGHCSQPLKYHQPRKQAICPAMDVVLRFLEKRFNTLLQSVAGRHRGRVYGLHVETHCWTPASKSGQPKTGVLVWLERLCSSKAMSALRPGLSPEWPREIVMPP